MGQHVRKARRARLAEPVSRTILLIRIPPRKRGVATARGNDSDAVAGFGKGKGREEGRGSGIGMGIGGESGVGAASGADEI